MSQTHNNSDSSGDRSPEKPQNKIETKAENKERGEASKQIADGELNKDISTQTLEKRLSRKSGATGYGVASADSLLPTEAEIQKMGKQLTAKMEQEKPIAVIAQNIGDRNSFNPQQPQVTDGGRASAGADGAKLLDDRPMIAQVHRENPEESFSESLKRLHPNEKLVPKDGDPPLTLKQLLNDYKTPFIDAYEQSRHLKDGEPGKSKTLEDIVDRMKACPWADQIRIKFDKNATNPEYDPVKNTITIRPQDKPDAQIQLFSHEAYHSTHQFLNTMYSGANLLDKQTFTNTLLGGEVGSMVAEAKVHQELKLGTEQPQFFFKNVQGVDDHIDIGPYVKEHGIRGLFDFLEKAEPVRKGQEPYGIYYQKNYQPYADHFAANKPAAVKIIQQWVKAGHKAEDI